MTPAKPPFQRLPLGSVQPRGWLLAQLRRDLETGFAGRLDALTPHAARDLFREHIASSESYLAWWDAETRGNWLWGYVAMAALAGLPEHQARVADLMAELLRTQDVEGYLGIYGPAWRYAHAEGENAELWAQSRALLALAAFYEATSRADVLAAIRRAVELTLRRYPEGTPYFRRGSSLGRDAITGLTHGLCYLDVLEWLHGVTGEGAYAQAGLRFYRDFSAMPRPFPNDDLALPNLAEPKQVFGGHAVHTAEHLRALLWTSALAPDQVPPEAVRAALERLARYRLPSGALLGDENIHGVPMPEAPYEYCTTTELALSLASGARHLGLPGFGDWLETLVFNAAQGARLPDGSAIAYLSADTRLFATAARPDAHSYGGVGRRFKYSPTHDDVACCCNPNAVRLLPQFIQAMWAEAAGELGVAAVAYGPCELWTRIAGAAVRITEDTAYPFGDVVELTVEPERPLEFTLLLRQPAWGTMDVVIPGAEPVLADGWYRIRKPWTAGDRVTIRFGWPVRADPYANGEVAVLRGPLQYVLPLKHRLECMRDYPVEGFHDYDALPMDLAQGYRIPIMTMVTQEPGQGPPFERCDADADHPWDRPPSLLRLGEATLVPMGCTILRRASFPITVDGAGVEALP